MITFSSLRNGNSPCGRPGSSQSALTGGHGVCTTALLIRLFGAAPPSAWAIVVFRFPNILVGPGQCNNPSLSLTMVAPHTILL